MTSTNQTSANGRPNEGTAVVIGAGPAGCSAAIRLAESNIPTVLIEADPVYVGGISRTVNYKGYRVDIGGHRFFTKSREVSDFWHEVMGGEFLRRRRMSRIYYRKRFFSYPLKPFDAFRKLGPVVSAACLLSYLRARLMPRKNVVSFEDWVVNQFGERLYRIFFKTYTEKVWGIQCTEISSAWAAQRIKGLNMSSLLKSLIVPQRVSARGKKVIKTLIDQFEYPRLGPGQLWERAAERFEKSGGVLRRGEKVVRLVRSPARVTSIETETASGTRHRHEVTELISSMPLRSLIESLDPAAPDDVRDAARGLRYRDFIVVLLVIDVPNLFEDNWIYVHEPDVKVGRLQNFKNWSPDMVADQSKTSLGLEYFCFRGDGLWEMSDAELLALGEREIRQIGLLSSGKVVDGTVVRMPKAYPVYDRDFDDRLKIVRDFVQQELTNVQLIGRNGMHRYNNQDHAVLTGMLAAENIRLGHRAYDPWKVNSDAIYQEEEREGEGGDGSGRLIPERLSGDGAD